MTRSVLILDSALDDLDVGRGFYERCEVGVGDYFLDCLFSDISSLKFYFGAHKIHNGFHRLLSKRFPFAVYYEIKLDVVHIVAVLDMRMRPSDIRKQVSSRKVSE